MAKVYDTATDIITFARLQSQNTTSGSSYLGSDGLLKFAAEDEPRIEYGSDGSLKGLLIEEQRTNLLTHSEQFDNPAWVKPNVTVTPNTAIAPDGSATADRAQFTSLGTSYLRQVITTVGGAEYTVSCWVKSNTGTDQFFRLYGNGGPSSSNQFTATSDWQLFSYTFTGNGLSATHGLRDDGVNTCDLQVWGAQLEAGSFATSYIPTSGSQVTRWADVASIPVSAFGYNQDAGTVVVEFDMVGFSPNGPTGYPRVWEFNQANSDYISVQLNSSGQAAFRDNESNTNLKYSEALTENTMAVMAATFADDDLATSLDGATALTATPSYTLDLPTTLAIGSVVGGGRYLNGHIKSLKYYPRRLTNTQLQELTA
jgi:hypothetical protein